MEKCIMKPYNKTPLKLYQTQLNPHCLYKYAGYHQVERQD